MSEHSETDGVERRRHKRARIDGPLPILNEATGQRLGVLVNISESGLLLASEQPLSEHQEFQLKLVLSEALDGEEDVQLSAECLWTNEAEDGLSYWGGFYILELSEHDRERIRNLIEAS